MPYRSPSPGKRGGGESTKFKIDVNSAGNAEDAQDTAVPGDALKTPAKGTGGGVVDTSNALIPKPRAAGGIWLNQSDFPHAFQSVIVYHNIKKYTHNEVYHDIWENTEEPYISNESEVYIKLELDEQAVEKVKQDEITSKNIGIQNLGLSAESSEEQLDGGGEENKEGEEAHTTNRSTDRLPLPGESEK